MKRIIRPHLPCDPNWIHLHKKLLRTCFSSLTFPIHRLSIRSLCLCMFAPKENRHQFLCMSHSTYYLQIMHDFFVSNFYSKKATHNTAHVFMVIWVVTTLPHWFGRYIRNLLKLRVWPSSVHGWGFYNTVQYSIF